MMKPLKRVAHYARWVVPAMLFAFLVFLWIRAGMDVRYMMRVLVHRESGTSDYRWKDSMPVAPAAAATPWLEAPNCSAVASAFAAEPGITDMNSYLAQGGALALVVVRNGAIVCEWYGNGGARDRPAAAFSLSKTVTSLLLARAVAPYHRDDVVGRIGVTFADDALRIIEIDPSGPAARTDLKVGDVVTSIETINVVGVDPE